MEEGKLVLASNIIKQRTKANMTQAELGERLNYSDKTISKWERAESLPDVLALKQMAELFNVSVDDMLCSHDKWDAPPESASEENSAAYSRSAIILVAITGIWTIAALVFVIFWALGTLLWSIFAFAVPTSLITLLVLNSIWYRGKYNLVIVSALVFSLITMIYIALSQYRPWQVFLVAIPAQIVVLLSFRIKKTGKKP